MTPTHSIWFFRRSLHRRSLPATGVRTICNLLALVLCAALAGGCNRQSGGAPPADTGSQATPGQPAGGGAGNRVSAEDGSGKILFVLEPSDKGYRIVDGGGRQIGSVKVESDRMKVSDAGDRPAFKLKLKDEGFKLYREPATAGGADVELARYQGSGDRFRILDPQDRELYRGKIRDTSVKVDGPGGGMTVAEKEDGVEVEDAAGNRLLRMRGLKSVPAAVFSASKEYDVLARAAVAAYGARIQP